ncbi:MAG: CDF family Co(II)/Ni(II) efflux transporter DmeF [Rhodopila sp.]|nr:CDF family Co(II)/Ni(II) efflux transporter DmeF [Rhodopila sp.]
MEPHSHIFLGEGHEHAEKRTWGVIWLCGAMMALEIVGGLLFGSIALVADGLHMSTHAGALLLAALAYRYARRHATDARFTFGTGKLGDLAGFTSAIVLAMIALLIGWEAVSRFLAPVPIAFSEAIPIACLGLGVNIVSAWLLGGGHHHHHHHAHEEGHTVELGGAKLKLEIHEDGVPPRFRVPATVPADQLWAETVRPSGARQRFAFTQVAGVLESVDEIPEPHAFTVNLHLGPSAASVAFEEHAHDAAHRDNNMRAAIIHVMADAAVSVLVIVGLLLARTFGWLWMDPLAGIIGACVIASWAYGLVRDTGRILLDMNPDRPLTERLRREIEADGDRLTDLHVWRLGPGHLGAVLSVVTKQDRRPDDYRQRLRHFASLSHITIEVQSL